VTVGCAEVTDGARFAVFVVSSRALSRTAVRRLAGLENSIPDMRFSSRLAQPFARKSILTD